MNSRFKQSALTIAVSSVLCSPHLTATAQETQPSLSLEEVIVTARKKEEFLSDVPMSITAVSGETIEQMNIPDMEQLQFSLPNLTIVSGGLTGQRAYVRGQGSESNTGFEQSVGWFVDGIYGGRGDQFKAPLFDVASVELLRGPQGTLLGKNIIAGAINIRSNRPTDELEGRITALYEDETGEEKVEAVISGPLTDTLSGRLALMNRETDGWVDNLHPDSSNQDIDARDEQVARLLLAWDPIDDLSVFFKYEYASAEVDGVAPQMHTAGDNEAALGLIEQGLEDGKANDQQGMYLICEDPALRDTYAFACGMGGANSYRDIETDNFVLEMSYLFGDYEVVSLTGWSAFDYEHVIDADHTASPTITSIGAEEFEQFSQELRITSPGGELIDWTVGLYYQDNNVDTDGGGTHITALPVFIQGSFDQDSETYSGFAEATWNITDNARFSLGARYTDESKEVERQISNLNSVDGSPSSDTTLLLFDTVLGGGYILGPNPDGQPNHILYVDEDFEDDQTTLQGTFQYDWQEHMLYAQVAEGYKAGGFNNQLRNRNIDQFIYGPEEALSYEVGGKFFLADGAANVNVAIFYTEYSDLQVSQFDGLSFNVTNAAESTSQGVEVDFLWQLTRGLRVGGALAYLDSEFDDFPDAACPSGSDSDCLQDLSGKDTQFAPEYSGNLFALYERELFSGLLFTSRLDYSYTDDYLAQADQDPEDVVPSYDRWDLRLGLGPVSGQWEVAVIGRNITDEEDYIHSLDVPLLTGAHSAVMLPPRTVAVQGTYRF